MSIPHLLLLYVALALGALCAVGIVSGVPALRAFRPGASGGPGFFCCSKCGFVYTDDADVDWSRCTQCGKLK